MFTFEIWEISKIKFEELIELHLDSKKQIEAKNAYRVYHGFEQAKFPEGSSVLGCLQK